MAKYSDVVSYVDIAVNGTRFYMKLSSNLNGCRLWGFIKPCHVVSNVFQPPGMKQC